MTVQDTPNFVNAVGNAVQVSFPFAFRADDVLWVSVDFVIDLLGITLNADQDSSPGGTVDYNVAPPNLQSIRIQRVTPQTQEMDYNRYDPFDSESHEDQLDKLMMAIQDLDAINTAETADLQAQIDAIVTTIEAGFRWEFVSFLGDRTLILTDAFKFLQSIDVGATQDITIPPNSDVAFALGVQITFQQKGVAILGFLPGIGVNIDSPGSKAVNAQFGTVTLIQDEIDNWVLVGNEAS